MPIMYKDGKKNAVKKTRSEFRPRRFVPPAVMPAIGRCFKVCRRDDLDWIGLSSLRDSKSRNRILTTPRIARSRARNATRVGSWPKLYLDVGRCALRRENGAVTPPARGRVSKAVGKRFEGSLVGGDAERH